MKFGFEQRYDAPVSDVVAVYIDESFWSGLDDLARTGAPEVLEVTRKGDNAVTRLRWHLDVELPSQASRFIDPDDVSWVEETTWSLQAATASVKFLPDQGAALMKASADVVVVELGDDSVRRIKGELRVRIPIVGGKVEHAVVDGIGEHLETEADAVAKRLGS